MMPTPDQSIPSPSYYPDQPGDLTGGLPMNLDSLRDGPAGTKPFYPYSTLIRYAIKGSPTGKLLLEDIYYAIETRFPYFKSAPAGWKNSVRHNLSLNPCFEKVPRPLTDRGKGSYWTVNDNVDPRTGVHRVRKKRTKAGSASAAGGEYNTSADDGSDFAAGFDPAMTGGANNRNGFNGTYQDFETPTFPLVTDPAPYTVEGELSLAVEMNPDGSANWRNMWLNELAKLQHVTAAQEKAGADTDWYRIMVTRVRGAFMPPDPQTMGMDDNTGAGQVPEE